MTSIDFYVLTNSITDNVTSGDNDSQEAIVHSDEHDMLIAACILCEKARIKQMRVHIQCKNQHQAEQLDQLLWSFKPDAFLPHVIVTETQAEAVDEAISIGWQSIPFNQSDVLINLTQQTIPEYARFIRLLEIVPADEDAKKASRLLYTEYKNIGYPLKKHNISTEKWRNNNRP